MGQLRIYPSTLPGEPAETHELNGQTLGKWLAFKYPAYVPGGEQPFIVSVNGMEVPPEHWHKLAAGKTPIDMHFKAQGGAFSAIGNVVSKIVNAVFGFLIPQAPKMRQQNTTDGRKLEPAQARANIARMNEIIPEGAGTFRRFPDYLLPPRRYFVDRVEQEIEMLLCIGRGKYQIPASRVLVGDTPLLALGDNATFTIYQPGESLEADNRREWWHSAPEVGGTSQGSAGLEMKATSPIAQIPSVDTLILSEYEISVPSGAGEFPDGWEGGMIVRLTAPKAWNVSAPVSGRNVLTGPVAELKPFAGMLIEIVGANEGLYIVHSFSGGELTLNYADGSPAGALQQGSVQMTVGYRGLRYRIVAAGLYQISVDRLTDTGAVDEDWEGFEDYTTSTFSIRLDGNNVEGGWLGPFAACPEGEVTNTLEFDVFFQGGLARIDDKGYLHPYTVTVEAQYRNSDTAGEWISFSKAYTAATLDQIGFTERVPLGSSYRPEVRMRRIGATAQETNIQDKVQWYGMRSLLPSPVAYEDVTVMAVRIRGGNRLAAQTENMVSAECTRVLPVRSNGAWDVETPTRSISAFVAHVARSIGHTDAQIDMLELDRLEATWTARNDTFNYFSKETTVKEIINLALRSGMSEMTIDRGRIRPVRDEPRSTFEHMYTPQNMTRGLRRSVEAVRPDEADGVDVEYTDSRTWATATVQCRLPGDLGIKTDKIKLDGVTSRRQAYQIGMRMRLEQKYRRWNYDFGTELDALNSRYMSYAALADDVPGYAQSAMLFRKSGNVLESSEPLDWSGEGHVVAVRRPDGTVNGPYPATRGATDYEVVANVPGVVIADNLEPPHILFGRADRWSFPALITDIKPNGFQSVSVSAVNYDARVYSYDDALPPA